MKQFLLFVSLAGAALYALLVYTHDAITDGKSERIPVSLAQPVHPVPQRLSSWESHLRNTAPNSQPTAHMPPQQNVAAKSESKSAVSTAAQVEWTKVVSIQASRELTGAVAIAAPQKSKKLSQSPKRSKSATRVSKRRPAVARWYPYRWGRRADQRRDFRSFMLGPPFASR